MRGVPDAVFAVLASVCVAAAVNLVTGGTWSWSLVGLAGLVLGAAALVVSTVWKDRARARERVRDRDLLMVELRPSADLRTPAAGRDTLAWLTARRSPTSLWGRTAELAALTQWCGDPAGGAVAVITGPAAVGKRRLALAVADRVRAESGEKGRCRLRWRAGWLLPGASGVVEAVVAAGEPTVVLVEEAERVPGIVAMAVQAAKHPELVRLLLLTRDAAFSNRLSEECAGPVVRLEAIGGACDRRRWFTEAAKGYARVLGVPPPSTPLVVGADDEQPLVIHARALLAVLRRTSHAHCSMAEVMSALADVERESWENDKPGAFDSDVLAEAVTVLATAPAAGLEEAAELLARVPQFSRESSWESRYAVARWVRRRYPPSADQLVGFQPRLVADRLVADTLARAQLIPDAAVVDALPVLLRIYNSFPDSLDTLGVHLARAVSRLPEVIATVLQNSVATAELDALLAALIDYPDVVHQRPALAELPVSSNVHRFPRSALALTAMAVDQIRPLAIEDPTLSAQLAECMFQYGVALRVNGRHDDAAEVSREAVGLRRGLVDDDPELNLPLLARSLHYFAKDLRRTGHHTESAAAAEEAVGILRVLAIDNPERHGALLAKALRHFCEDLRHNGRLDEALAAIDEAIVTLLPLVDPVVKQQKAEVVFLCDSAVWETTADLAYAFQEEATCLTHLGMDRRATLSLIDAVNLLRYLAESIPEHYKIDFAYSLAEFGYNLRAVGNATLGADVTREAVAIMRSLDGRVPADFPLVFGRCLYSLSVHYRGVGRQRDAFALAEEAVRRLRTMQTTFLKRHRPALAAALNGLSISCLEHGLPNRALALVDEAIAISKHTGDDSTLAHSLYQRARALSDKGCRGPAVKAARKAVEIRRRLVAEAFPLYGPRLAVALRLLRLLLTRPRQAKEMMAVWREEVDVLARCADLDPVLHGANYRLAASQLRIYREAPGEQEPMVLRAEGI